MISRTPDRQTPIQSQNNKKAIVICLKLPIHRTRFQFIIFFSFQILLLREWWYQWSRNDSKCSWVLPHENYNLSYISL